MLLTSRNISKVALKRVKGNIHRLVQPRVASSVDYIRSFQSSSSVDESLKAKSAPAKSWVPTEQPDLQKVTTTSLIHEISMQQMQATTRIVPWFLAQMPASYFRQVPEEIRKQHIKAVTAIRELGQSDLSLKIVTKDTNGSSQVTFMSSENSPGSLHKQIKTLVVPPDSRLANVKVFSSFDGELALNIFSFESTNTEKTTASRQDAQGIYEYASNLRNNASYDDSGLTNKDILSESSLDEYLTRISASYARSINPRRFLLQREMFEKVRSTESVDVNFEHVEDIPGVTSSWLTIAAANVLPEVLLQLSSSIISASGLDISRAHLDTVQDPLNEMGPDMPGYVTMLRLLINDHQNPSVPLDSNSNRIKTLIKDIKRSKWLDNSVTELGLVRYPSLGVDKAEVIVALISMLHGPLSKKNSQAYASIKSMIQLVSTSDSHIDCAAEIAEFFLEKFNPASPLSKDESSRRALELETKIKKIQNESVSEILRRMVEAVNATLRTNVYNEDRYALALRVHPSIMATGTIGQPNGKPLPFGVIFIHGRHFNGFHCRFRDIARGGLRLVTPRNSDQHALESSRQFDEAYGLSYAQQLKNKDIPEGGSKAVLLVDNSSIAENKRFFAYRKCVKAFTDSVLDLVVKDSVKNLVDLYGKDELIYLGPDEQIIPFDIDWICNRAAQRGYPIPAAFMSSKKGAGINHKVYGVTSEGVVVYLDVALRRVLNIDPHKQSFTIKITGGPDGDVAGNLIKILFREYGSNCKVVGVADGFGVAEDPDGLDSEELLRLVQESLPINSFNSSKLGKNGIVLDASTNEGFERRNSMHNRVKADAFCPAGGRPNTINIDNWRLFLDPATGKPSSPLIVEGANIFTTPEAREQLFLQGGVRIVKDSSANKCGVITSSCEVAASMLLSTDEFLSIKKELVDDVLVRLKHLARLEAELLFREFSNYPGSLPHYSERISDAINKVTDAITDGLEGVNPGDPLFQELLPLIKTNLPKKLAEVAWDRVPSRFPVQYQRNAIASTLASHIVYKEGIHLVESQPIDKLAKHSFEYYRKEAEINKLLEDFETKGLSGLSENEKETIVDLLRRGGARTALDIF